MAASSGSDGTTSTEVLAAPATLSLGASSEFDWGDSGPVVTTKTASLVEWTAVGKSTRASQVGGITATVNGSLWMDG